jgi:uncharacterized membrane protein (UPF0182 family)
VAPRELGAFPAATTPQRPDTAVAAVAALARQAVELYDRARAAQRNDDWAAYGTAMRQLGDVLRRLEAERAPR